MNQWTITTEYSGPERRDARKIAVSPVYVSPAAETTLQLLFAQRNGLDEAFMVIAPPRRIAQVTLSGRGLDGETVGVEYQEMPDSEHLKYELTGRLVTLLRDVPSEIELNLLDEAGESLDYIIPRGNSAQIIKSVRGVKSGNKSYAGLCLLVVFLIGIGLFNWSSNLWPTDAGETLVPEQNEILVPNRDEIPTEAVVVEPEELAQELVTPALYRWALNCEKIGFLTSASERINFSEIVIERMDADLRVCGGGVAVRTACETENCWRKFHDISEYSTWDLNEFYEKHTSLTTQLTATLEVGFIRSLSLQAPRPVSEVVADVTSGGETTTAARSEAAVVAVEQEVLGRILEGRNLHGMTRGVREAAKVREPIQESPEYKESPVQTIRYVEELDVGAQVRLGYDCAAGFWEIRFTSAAGLGSHPKYLIEFTWPDGEITPVTAQVVDGQVRWPAKETARDFSRFTDGLIFVHINYDHNYHWDLEEVHQINQLSKC